MSIVSDRLRTARTQKALSQMDVMRLTQINNKTLSGYENAVSEPDYASLVSLANIYGVTTDYLLGRVDSPTDSLVPTATEPLDPTIERIGYTDPSPAAQKIADAIDSDPELLAFWKDVSQRPDLQLLCRQTKSMTPETIRKVMRIIKAIEEEEANED